MGIAANIETKLAEMGLALPEAPKPAANYEPFVIHDGLLHVSGQISAGPDGLITGRLGDNMTTEEGAEAARACALSLLAQARAACDGDLDRVARLVKLTGFVACTPDFTEQPKVINGASDLMAELLGEAGRHARAAVGVAALPLGVAVEVEAVFALA
ncbi:RidA family protein [Limimaricola soesokkakensis]|uniref:RidA family protein n=1 Tax=Limimaricola soesokkakensis TaxID=1343159 RepID=UPI00351162DC